MEGEEEEFVGDAGHDREPVMVDEGGAEVLPGLGVSGNPGRFCTYWNLSRALLGTIDKRTGSDEGMDEGFCHGV